MSIKGRLNKKGNLYSLKVWIEQSEVKDKKEEGTYPPKESIHWDALAMYITIIDYKIKRSDVNGQM